MGESKGFVEIGYHMRRLAEARETVASLEARIAQLRQENTRLQNENERLKQQISNRTDK